MFRDLGLDNGWLLIDEDPAGDAVAILLRNWRDPETARAEVEAAMGRVRAKSERMIQGVRDTAAAPHPTDEGSRNARAR